MSQYRPTQEQQRVLYNYFQALISREQGVSFTPLPPGVFVTYGTTEIVAALSTLYGHKCHVPNCKGVSTKIIVEHINGDKNDYRPENLRLACRSCNQNEIKYQQQVPSGDTGNLKRENTAATESAQESASKVKRSQMLASVAPTFQKSKEYKRKVRILLMQWTAGGRALKLSTAIVDVVALVGCQEGKAEEYINGFSKSRFSPFRQVVRDGEIYIVENAEYDARNACEEDRDADAEAAILIMSDQAREIEQKREEMHEATMEHKATMLHMQVIKELGVFVDVKDLAIRPIDYLLNSKKYRGSGTDHPTCIKCGQRKPIDTSEVVCASCRAAVKAVPAN